MVSIPFIFFKNNLNIIKEKMNLILIIKAILVIFIFILHLKFFFQNLLILTPLYRLYTNKKIKILEKR